jgi:hypothetical protein
MRILTQTCTLACCAYLTGAFAMNLGVVFMFSHEYYPFVLATVGTAAFAIFGGIGFQHYLKVKGLLPIEATYHERARQEVSEECTILAQMRM